MITGEYERLVAEIGAGRRGIVRHDLAIAAGATDAALHRLRHRGLLVPVGACVDRLRDHPFDWGSQCQAALDLAGAGAALGLRSSARVHGSYAYRASVAVEVVVLRGGDHRTSIGRLIETRWLPAQHVTTVDGFPVTTMARTFFDLCGDPEPGLSLRHPYHGRAMARVYNDALARRGMTFTQEAAVVGVMAKRGRRGSRLARRTLERFGPTHEPTRSDTESLFMEVVWAHGLPEPEKQVALTDVAGWVGTVDFLWRAARVIVEVDSSWHDGPLDREEDAARDAALRAAGYTVLRYRYGDLVRRPEAIARELAVATRVEAKW